jgi:hypothetical protein
LVRVTILSERRWATTDREAELEITVEGENVGKGEIDLSALAAFATGLQKAMRAVAARARQRPTKGRPAKSVDRATGLRLVAIRAGSTTLVLRSSAEDQFGGLADDTLNALERAITEPKERLESSVVAALDEARRGLGSNGMFTIRRSPQKAPLVFDVQKLEELRRRAQSLPESVAIGGAVTVSGWLHMIDLAPDEVVIATPEGIEWRATYPDELELTVRSLVGDVVIASGTGMRTGAASGRLQLEALTTAPQLSLGKTFLVDGLQGSNDLARLIEDQGIQGPQAVHRPADLTASDVEGFLGALGRLRQST